jgi:hypothetical protein
MRAVGSPGRAQAAKFHEPRDLEGHSRQFVPFLLWVTFRDLKKALAADGHFFSLLNGRRACHAIAAIDDRLLGGRRFHCTLVSIQKASCSALTSAGASIPSATRALASCSATHAGWHEA